MKVNEKTTYPDVGTNRGGEAQSPTEKGWLAGVAVFKRDKNPSGEVVEKEIADLSLLLSADLLGLPMGRIQPGPE